MFGFGLKSRDVDMLHRTLTELQELRAEISVLREQLVVIKPADPESGPDLADSHSWSEEAEMAEGVLEQFTALGIDESMTKPPAPGEDKTREAVSGGQAMEALPEEANLSYGEETSTEKEVSAAAESNPFIKDKGAGEYVGNAAMIVSENYADLKEKIKRDWAVVDYKAGNRQWWQIWRKKTGGIR